MVASSAWPQRGHTRPVPTASRQFPFILPTDGSESQASGDKQRQREVREAAKRLDQERLSKAARSVRVDLICHRDTWGFIEGWTFPVGEIGPPPEQATLIKVPLYGPELVRIMTAMRFTGDKIASERAMASRVYDAIIEVIDRVDPADRFVLPHIVIDDGRPR